MNTKQLLLVSLLVNLILLCGLIFLTRKFERLPDTTPASVIYVTNAPPVALDGAAIFRSAAVRAEC